MKKAQNQLHRHWSLLQRVPIRPAAKTAQQLTDELRQDGFNVSKRTIERDLNELKRGPFAVVSDEKGIGNNPNKWFFERDAKLHLLPAMNIQTAFTLMFAKSTLSDSMPPSVLGPMTPIFEKAETTLAAAMKTYKDWGQYIKHVPRSMKLIPAKLREGVLDRCLEAVLKEHQLSMTYQPKHDTAIAYQVNPLGLVFVDGVIYLICTLWHYEDIKQLALQRILSITEFEDLKSKRPKHFNLDEYISKQGAFAYDYTPQKAIKVLLKFERVAAMHLYETPLSETQTIEDMGDYCLVESTVINGAQFRWWLLAFGAQVEVLKPKNLREEFRIIARKLQLAYSDT